VPNIAVRRRARLKEGWHARAYVTCAGASRVRYFRSNNQHTEDNVGLASILWAVVVILVVLWLIGLVAGFAGGLIHLLLVIAIIIVLYNLFVGRRTV
jgi:hypothetical protein